MKKHIIFAIVGLSVSYAMPVGAQSYQPPAELPPPGFNGSQYVDSKGCIYIRAGVSGAVSWVPRVTRDRQQVCGYKPSFSSGRSAGAAVAVTPSAAVPADTVVLSQTAPGTIGPDTRILPKHLYDLRKVQKPVTTPKGYRSAWQDGRLNKRRAEGTLRGREQMQQIWTNTVPRRLIVPD